MSIATKLDRSFFNRSTPLVAQELLGKTLYFQGKTGRIVETEAYVGQGDPACHAARGLTPRTKVMFGPAGYSYVYFIYGMYHCLNLITEAEGTAAGVLIRALFIPGIKFTQTNGPGKLCRFLGIDLSHNALDIVTSEDFYVLDTPSAGDFDVTPRIGIKVGTDKLWRFVAKPF
jgi:DNA-3-methyladenine glycosylase